MRNKIAFALLLAATPASAHVTLAEGNAAAGSTYVALFRIGHGCSGAATTALRIEIPDSIASAKPQPKPGWAIEIAHAPLAKPVQGQTITERVTAITWKGGPLPDDQFDEFAVMMKLPAKAASVMFPATQTCVKGEEHWSDAPMAGMKMDHPAPILTLTPATARTGDSRGAMHGM